MEYLPLFFDLKSQPCLLVGGGEVAHRKAVLMERAGARITVVSPEICAELIDLIKVSGGELIYSQYESSLMAGKKLAIAATDSDKVNQAVHADAIQHNIPINVVDCPELCSFVFPAIIDRSPIMVAVSSGGKAPVLTRLLRAKLETLIPAYYGELGRLAGRYRDRVMQQLTDMVQRRRFWERVFQGRVADRMISGQSKAAEAEMEALLAAEEFHEKPIGEVYLVGAGPGDPELLTFKALRLMQQADVVLYDRLVSPTIVDLCRRDADRVYVGKEMSNHSVPQEGINSKLVELAQQGKRVLRLKGGDPFMFGRGGEELEMLAELGIPFQVVPGITAALACSSYTGIPLTHRDYAQSVKFITGHLKNRTSDLNWPELLHPHQTIVLYMALHRIDYICQQLIQHGKDPKTPIALVQAASTPEQKVLTATLETIAERLAENPMKAPTLTIIGEVVDLHDKLAWFDKGLLPENWTLINPG